MKKFILSLIPLLLVASIAGANMKIPARDIPFDTTGFGDSSATDVQKALKYLSDNSGGIQGINWGQIEGTITDQNWASVTPYLNRDAVNWMNLNNNIQGAGINWTNFSMGSDGTNISIGTTTPTARLEVRGGGIAGESVNKGYELIIPSPSFLNTNNREVTAFGIHKGNLLIGYYDAGTGTKSAKLGKWDGKAFSLLYTFGTGSAFQNVTFVVSMNGNIYVGVEGTATGDGDVYVSTDDGATFTKSFENTADVFSYSATPFKGYLYVGAGYNASRIYRFNGTWSSAVYAGMGLTAANLVCDMTTHKGRVFAGIGNGGAHGGIVSSSSGDSGTWVTELSLVTITRFTEFQGRLYATSQLNNGATPLYVRDDTTGTWSVVTTFASNQCWGLENYNDSLYVGCTVTGGGKVWVSRDGATFDLDFTNNTQGGLGTEPFRFKKYNGSLYLGWGFSTNATADIWRKTDSVGQLIDSEVSRKVQSAGINWDSLYQDIQSAGVNWTSLNQAIQRAGVNWTSLSNDIQVGGINWASINITGIPKFNGSSAPTTASAGTDYVATETDPQVGAVTNAKWCQGDGSAVQCNQDAPTSTSALDDLSDVTITSAASAQVLINDGAGQFKNRTLSGDVAIGTTGVATVSGYVPTSRTVNGHALSSNVTVTPTDLSLVIGTNTQAWDADLDYLATFTPAANIKSILNAADYPAVRTLLGLVIGTNVQAYDSDLDYLATFTPAANIKSILNAADYAAVRALLDLEAGTDFYSITAANAAFQPLDSDLTYLAGFTPSTNVKTILNAADNAAVRTALSLVVGTNVQAYDADLDYLSGFTPSTNVKTILNAADNAAVKTALSLNNVENTAVSTWAGSSNLTTVGTLTTGTWNAGNIGIGTTNTAFANLTAMSGNVGIGTWKPTSALQVVGAISASSTIGGSNFSGTSSGTNTGDQTTVSGNAGTATILQTARNINGTSFNGSGDITVTAAAGTLTGATLASGVTASSLTSFGSSIALGTPASGTLTNATGLPEGGLSLTDITTNNVTSTKHGFAPKSPADATQFLNGATTSAFAAVKDSDLSTTDVLTNNATTSKHGFVPKCDGNAAHYFDGNCGFSTPSGSGTNYWGTGGTGIGTTVPVGIGTFGASASLEIVKASGTAPMMISSVATADGDFMIVSSLGNVGIGTTNTAFNALSIMNGNVGIGTFNASAPLSVQAPTSLDTTLLSANVGIGTATPRFQLETFGGVRFTAGHVNTTGGTAPTTGTCCTGNGTITSGSTDFAGEITFGTSTCTACTVNFGTAFTSTPFCNVTLGGSTSSTIRLSAESASAITATMGTSSPSGKMTWTCIGNKQ